MPPCDTNDRASSIYDEWLIPHLTAGLSVTGPGGDPRFGPDRAKLFVVGRWPARPRAAPTPDRERFSTV